MEVSNNEYENPTTYIDSNDICMVCKNQYGCPLIECLNRGLVVMNCDCIEISQCELFSELI